MEVLESFQGLSLDDLENLKINLKRKMKNIKIKTVFLPLMFALFPFFVFASLSPQVSGYKIDGKQESVKLNPSRGDTASIEINANVPVKFNTIALCATTDAVCSRATAVKYFTQTDFALSVSKEWDGKTSKDAIVPDGDYKIKVTMKDETGQENIQELTPYIITIDSSLAGGSGGSSSSVSQGSSSQTQSSSPSFSPTAGSGTSYFISVNSSSSTGSSSIAKYSNTFEVSAGSDRLVYTDTPVDFVAEVGVPKGFSEQAVKFIWSFGDGGTGEGKKVSHIYKFPGDYIVVLNGLLSETSAVSRANVKVINSSVFISNTTVDSVEITNQGAYEINLKGWSVSNSHGKFIFSSDTIIAPNKKIAVPDEYMKLNLAQGGKVSLLNPSGKDASLSSVVSGGGLSAVNIQNNSANSSLDNDPAVKKIREFIATGGKSPVGNSSSVLKSNLNGQNKEAPGAKNKTVSISEKDKIISSSTQVAATVSSQVPRRGFMRSLLSLPSAGLNLIKKAFYSGN